MGVDEVHLAEDSVYLSWTG